MAAVGTLLLAGLASAAGAECIESRPEGLCTAKLSSHRFAPPNTKFPAGARGVYWIDAGDDSSGHSVSRSLIQPWPLTATLPNHTVDWCTAVHRTRGSI